MWNVVAVMSILSVLGFSTAASAQSSRKPEASQMSTLKVSGMACGACAASVEAIVKKIDGVSTAVISHPKGTAEITFDPAKTNPQALVKTINAKTSFKAELMSAHPKR